jgi:citrate synthase
MSEAHTESTKKHKKHHKNENGVTATDAEEIEQVEPTEAETQPKKSKKHKKTTENVDGTEEAVEEVAELAIEGEKKEKKKKKHAKATSVEKEEEVNEKVDDASPRRVGPAHDTDVAGVVASFNSCIVKAKKGSKHDFAQDIHIGRFIQAFKDLLPILRLLGTAFYFVEQDIVQKLDAIAENQAKQTDTDHARNLIDFINWEKESNPKILTDKHTTARHALRLMRALHFISLFLDKLNEVGVEPKPAAKEAYAVSLSHYHPWSVRTAVSLAFYTLPYRKSFLKHLQLAPEGENHFVDFVTVTTRIRDILNLYYDANDWQKLP